MTKKFPSLFDAFELVNVCL